MGTRVSKPLGLVAAVLLAAFVVGIVCQPALAAPGRNPNVKIGIHTKAHPTSCTKGYPTFTTCSNIVTTWGPTGDLDVMPIFYDLAEITVTEFGLTWPAQWGTMSWVRCKGTIAVGGILNPGDGTAISWSTCQNAWSQAPGYGWLIATGPGAVTPIPYFATGDYGVVDCQSPPAYNYPVSTASAGIGGTPGQDPCIVPIVAPTLSMVDNIGSTSCAFPESTIIYTLKYKNTNASGITGVTLVDSLPPYVDFVSATGGGTPNADTSAVTWSIGAMAAGDSGTVNLTVRVQTSAPVGGVLVNRASIGCAETTQKSTTDVSTHICACLIDGPTLVCPSSTGVFCAPSGVGFIYAWSVSGSGSISGSASGRCVNVIAGSACNEAYTVSLTVTDGQGIISQCNQDVTVDDTEAPVITSYPEDVVVQCLADVPPVSTRDVRGTDNCGTPTASHAGDDTTGTACNWVINRTYLLTDACGLYDQEIQHITVRDTIPPQITSCPGNANVQCVTDVPAPNSGLVIATDNCGSVVKGHLGDDTTGTACDGQIVRRYRAADPCGNTTDCVQTFTILDTTQPDFVGAVPRDTTVECHQVPAPTMLTAVDNCDASVTVGYADVRTNGVCPDYYTLTRTWTATDDCGNSRQHVQIITVRDTTHPQFVEALPGDVPVECDAVPTAPTLTAVDNCDASVRVDYGERRADGSCPANYTLVRTWAAVDDCGNVTQHVQTITVRDATAPVFTSHPSDVAVQCRSDIPTPNPGFCTATDNCGTVTISFVSDASDGHTCPEVVTRTYRATDQCNNSRDEVQLITVDDTQAPTLLCRSDKRVRCGGPISFDDPDVSDICDPSPVLTIVADSTHVDPVSGDITHTRCWTATDACGNTSLQCCQNIVEEACAYLPLTITKDDGVSACVYPGDYVTYDLSYGNPNDNTVTGTVLTDHIPDGTDFETASGGGSFDAGTRIVTWNIGTLGGLNTGSESVTIRVQASVAPGTTLVNQCSIVSSETSPSTNFHGTRVCPCLITGVNETCPGASEQFCGPAGMTAYTWTVTGGGFIGTLDNERCVGVVARAGCDTTYTVRLVVTDASGVESTCEKIVTVIDSTPPAFTSVPTTINVQCRSAVPAPAPSDLTATDACSAVTITWVSDNSDGNTCPEIITRTYRATDACGNSADTTHYIRVHDTTPPVITCPGDVTRECSSVTDTGVATAIDNCDGELVPGYADNIVPGGGPGCYTIQRTWRVKDSCNNGANCLQIITVIDSRRPVITCTPDDSIGCTDPLVWSEPDVIDECAGIIRATVVSTDTVYLPTGEVQYTRCWEASDGCGNTSGCCQMITREACPFVPLVLTKDDNVVRCVNPGGPVTYTLGYRNPNAGPVTEVILVDFLSEDVTLVDAHGGVYSDDPPRVTWMLGTLGAGESGEAMLDVAVNAGVPYGSQIGNDASLDCAETEPTTQTLLTDVCSGELMVYFDIRPEACPNTLNPKAKGVLPAAVLGTAGFDVEDIDPASLRVTRESMSVGVAPLRWSYGDMATPAAARPCDCNTYGPDGHTDLGLKFSLVDLVNTLRLADAKGLTVELTLTGRLKDGTPIRGMDCVRVLGRVDDSDGGVSLMMPSGLGFEASDQVGVPEESQVDLSFYSAQPGRVTMAVYNVHGRLVANLLDSEMAAGRHLMTWNMVSLSGQGVPAGIYFVRLSTATESVTKKLIVVE